MLTTWGGYVSDQRLLQASLTPPQNKKRKYGQEGLDERDKDEGKKEEDSLKDATTLYVGNLSVFSDASP